ncbi:MAG: NAD-dependent epimerase/dehydratase family protein [Pseudomonadota bacterium]|nr:NAD-dependent epimerase/dehydratase family protein [Pseudomonadota bacterium]
MAVSVLITGGAGFIGSHVSDELLAAGYRVRALDNLHPQVHEERCRPAWLDDRVELVVGDVRDPGDVRAALDGMDAVVHLAAAVGVGQSMYRLVDYTSTNNVGTAVLLEALVERPVARLVVASSMSIYGEGRYEDAQGRAHDSVTRVAADLRRREWSPLANGVPLRPVPTPEEKPPGATSVYALSKYDQERMCLLVGQAYGIPTVALRLFNVYGPRQSLSNPYTGVLSIFASRLLNGRAPFVFEDGEQRRDFVNVRDVARAFRLALEADGARGQVMNVGFGRSASVREVAERIATALGCEHIAPEISGKFRVGDIRHCFADTRKTQEILGFSPRIELEEGVAELGTWLAGRTPVDRVDLAQRALVERGLTL